MPAAAARSDVRGCCMPCNSHDANYSSTIEIRIGDKERLAEALYDANMARKSAKSDGIRPETPDWFLKEWMAALKISQAALAKECDWTNSTMHGIYHGRTGYYREIVNLIASKLRIQPWELLMHPEQANAFKQYRASAERVARIVPSPEPPASDRKTGTDDN